jgi:YidC/Oxa1 family membrane protein insertase
MPIFLSMFMGLRGMANLPLESMMHGGLFWFEDLTIADPFYALPVMTSITMFLQFKFAAEGASMDTAGPIAKNVFRVLPFALLPMTINFPAVNFVFDCLLDDIIFFMSDHLCWTRMFFILYT